MAKKRSRLTTLEKFNNARREYEAGKFDTIEEAAEAHDICAATYYNYNKKVPSQPKIEFREIKTEGNIVPEDLLEENKKLRAIVMSSDESKTIKSLQDQVNKLKDKLIEMVLAKG